MIRVRTLVVAILLAIPALAAAQGTKPANMEDTLWDVDQHGCATGRTRNPTRNV